MMSLYRKAGPSSDLAQQLQLARPGSTGMADGIHRGDQMIGRVAMYRCTAAGLQLS